MVWSGGVTIHFLFAVSLLSCESAYQELNSLNDLKNIDFGKSVPKHSLLLLHWFANRIKIDNNNVMYLTFDPNTDFGSHHYRNYEQMLDPLPRGYRYYTVGNTNLGTSHELPDYVLDPPVREYRGTNMDRIIFRVQELNSEVRRIDRVYITQHYPSQSTYNPEYTYQISTNLLQQIRFFSVEENQRSPSELRGQFHICADDSQLNDLNNTWGNLACLGLLLFIVIQEKHCNRPVNRPPNTQPSEQNGAQSDERTKTQPNDESNTSVHSGELDQSEHTDRVPFNSNEQDENRRQEPEQKLSSSTCEKLYVFLVVIFIFILFLMCGITLFRWCVLATFQSRGECSQKPSRIEIIGYKAHLEYFVRTDKACARIYVSQDFSRWRADFHWSWVGFYKSNRKDTDEYEWGQWQWATKLKPCFVSVNDIKCNCFEYCSHMDDASGVHARFILEQDKELARSPDMASFSQISAHLQSQLFVRNGHACARLYVKKSFSDWKSEFQRSWVRFYKSTEKNTMDYDWQWATKFKQCPNSESYWQYNIFEYCSGVVAGPGVQIQFIQ